jgi:hypothetical protein
MIAPDSQSYPFLAIARKYDIDYGTVLLYSDSLFTSLPNFWEQKAKIEMWGHRDAALQIIHLSCRAEV